MQLLMLSERKAFVRRSNAPKPFSFKGALLRESCSFLVTVRLSTTLTLEMVLSMLLKKKQGKFETDSNAFFTNMPKKKWCDLKQLRHSFKLQSLPFLATGNYKQVWCTCRKHIFQQQLKQAFQVFHSFREGVSS